MYHSSVSTTTEYSADITKYRPNRIIEPPINVQTSGYCAVPIIIPIKVPRIGSINTETDTTMGGNHFNTPLIPVWPINPGPIARYAIAGIQIISTQPNVDIERSWFQSDDSINIDDIPSDILEREKNILIEEARDSGKPEEIIEKMIGGRLNKYYQESVLLEQTFVIDGESKVSEILNSFDYPIEITNFVRFELGEGIEKSNEEDFASEVDSMISSN